MSLQHFANYRPLPLFEEAPAEAGPEAVDSPFTVVIDSSEQIPYRFESIVGDYRDDYRPVRVKAVRKRLRTGDYSLLQHPGIAIERKSKEDLFGSVRNGEKRDNFLERLRRMEEGYRYAAILVECSPEAIYEDPPLNTSTSPKSVYRTALAWQQEFPTVHWVFCRDRDWAEQTCYRMLEKFYQHETFEKYRSHNKLVRQALDDFIDGMVARKHADAAEIPLAPGSPRRNQWLLGWGWASAHHIGSDLGRLYEKGEMPLGPVNPEESDGRRRRSKRKPTDPDPMDVARSAAPELF